MLAKMNFTISRASENLTAHGKICTARENLTVTKLL
jgi:hypothetical protein